MRHLQQIIKHELLNALTKMSLLLEEEKTLKTKQHLLKLIELASLLVMYEGVSKKKNSFFHQKTSLQELLETVVHLEHKRPSNIHIRVDKHQTLRLDRYYFKEALKQIIRKLCERSGSISIEFSEKRQSLVLMHERKKQVLQKIPFSQLFTKKHPLEEVSLQLGLEFLKVLKIGLEETPGEIALLFPEETRI